MAGAAVFAVLWVSAVSLDGSWTFGEDTLSELGRMGGGGRDLFNSGVIVSALIWIPFALALYRSLGISISTRFACALFLLAALALLCIGLFPIDSGTPHTIASWTFFIVAMCSLLVMSRSVRDSEVYGRVGFALTLIAPLLSLGLLALTSVPLAEAVAVVGLMVWASIMSSLMLLNQ